jgi:o-succinylbenzoate synthase
VKIWSSVYTLQSRRPLSGSARSLARRGALLKVETEQGIGYADLHPWEELGDQNLGEQLKVLATDQPLTPLVRQSLEMAAIDRKFRSAGQSAFLGLTIPDSHFLLNDLTIDLPSLESELRAKAKEGFRFFKLKSGRELAQEFANLEACASNEEFSDLVFRLDFNGRLNFESFLEFWGKLSERAKAKIEFVEDPLSWSIDDWLKLSAQAVPLALDRLTDSECDHLETMASSPTAFQWMVLKPAVQNTDRLLTLIKLFRAKLCVTSYLDHPVGQAGAALVAAQLAAQGLISGVCGLASHLSFEENIFSESLHLSGSRLLAPSGTGIGFDEQLNRLDWTLLK